MSIPKDGHGPSIFKHLPLPWVARADSWDGYVVRSSNGAVVINFGQAFQGYAECFGLSKIVSQAICDAVNAQEVPPETRNHDNHAMLARRVGELEREVKTLRAALRSARLIFDGVGDA